MEPAVEASFREKSTVMFKALDTDNDGFVDKEETLVALRRGEHPDAA